MGWNGVFVAVAPHSPEEGALMTACCVPTLLLGS